MPVMGVLLSSGLKENTSVGRNGRCFAAALLAGPLLSTPPLSTFPAESGAAGSSSSAFAGLPPVPPSPNFLSPMAMTCNTRHDSPKNVMKTRHCSTVYGRLHLGNSFESWPLSIDNCYASLIPHVTQHHSLFEQTSSRSHLNRRQNHGSFICAVSRSVM
jgi:hypothetical protein